MFIFHNSHVYIVSQSYFIPGSEHALIPTAASFATRLLGHPLPVGPSQGYPSLCSTNSILCVMRAAGSNPISFSVVLKSLCLHRSLCCCLCMFACSVLRVGTCFILYNSRRVRKKLRQGKLRNLKTGQDSSLSLPSLNDIANVSLFDSH